METRSTSLSQNEDPDLPVEKQREQWSRKLDAILSFIGYCVGLGNIWRFPYICMRNGGGAFLIPFLIFLVICGLPLCFLEVALGQFSGKGACLVWEICPLFRGVGIGIIMVNIILSVYWTMIIAWVLYYVGSSVINPLPWTGCNNPWNTDECFSGNGMTDRLSNLSITVDNTSTSFSNASFVHNLETSGPRGKMRITSEEEFWQYRVLNISPGIEQIGSISWSLSLCLLASFVLLYLCLIRGVRSSGKVVYVTATLPYILLTVLLIRGLLLPGATDGVLFYIKPDFRKLLEGQVWVEAALQVFYSLGPLWGPLITMGSFNKFNNNCYRDSVLLVFICEGTSIFGGFVVFAILGYMAHTTNLPISSIVKSGPGLVFVAYPEALTELPLPNLWSFVFFLMVLTVGMDSQMLSLETVFIGLSEMFSYFQRRRLLMSAILCVVWYLIGLLFCTEGGVYMFQLIDWYISTFAVPIFGLIECLIIGWIYGVDKFSRDISLMLNREVNIFFRVCWRYVTPFVVTCLLVFTLVTYQPPKYGNYQYPAAAVMFGWFIAALPIIPLPIYAYLTVRSAEGRTLLQKIKFALKPSTNWGPVNCIGKLSEKEQMTNFDCHTSGPL